MKSRSLAALSVSVVFALSGIPAYAGEAEADPFGKYEETLDVHFVRATDDTIETYALGNLPGQTLEDNFWLDTYRDELGINVVYDWVVKGDDEYNQKINITIATGELPDIMSVMDLCQYFEHKKLKGYADFFNSSSSFCCGVI